MSTCSYISERAQAHKLLILGGFHDCGKTMLLLGPDEPAGFWDHFSSSEEAKDGKRDPMDRWSLRVIGQIAADIGAEALFPFEGPPYHPFFTWALKTGRIHESPVKLLVHDQAGLWVSFRGALQLDREVDLPDVPPNPCLACEDRPCRAACPIGALSEAEYDVPACKTYIRSPEGRLCDKKGCQVRAACPVSRNWGRVAAQSEHHMHYFSPS